MAVTQEQDVAVPITYNYEGAYRKFMGGVCATLRRMSAHYATVNEGNIVQATIKDRTASPQAIVKDGMVVGRHEAPLIGTPALLQLLNEFNPWDETYLTRVMTVYYPGLQETDTMVTLLTFPLESLKKFPATQRTEIIHKGLRSQNPEVRGLFLLPALEMARQFRETDGEGLTLFDWMQVLAGVGLLPSKTQEEWTRELTERNTASGAYADPETVAVDTLFDAHALDEIVNLAEWDEYFFYVLGLAAVPPSVKGDAHDA